MRLQKMEQNEKVQYFRFYDGAEYGEYNFLDFINCGDCYVLAEWIIDAEPTITLNKDTILEDLSEEHGSSVSYTKFCKKTFRAYKSMDGDFWADDLDEVLSWTEIDYSDRHDYVEQFRAIITGDGMEELSSVQCFVRWASEGSSRGEDWYRLLKD